jgi:hypothetical protein
MRGIWTENGCWPAQTWATIYEARAELLIVAGLRRRADEVKREAKKMPIHYDIMDHEVIGPLIRQSRAEGRIEGQTDILLRMIEKRFGSVSPGIRERVTALKPAQLERTMLRLLDAERMEDLFRR